MSSLPAGLPRRPRIRSDWDLLFLADGSVVFAGFYGQHLRLPAPSAPVRKLLSLLDGERTTDALFATAFGRSLSMMEQQSLRAALQKLVEAGIVEEGASAVRPAWVDDALQARFTTQLGFLSKFATAERDEYALFKRLRDATVLVLGVGGNGSHVAMQLAAAGIGRLVLVDGDLVSESNLVRQIFYDEADCERVSKVASLSRKIRALTRFTAVEPIEAFVRNEADALRILGAQKIDFVLLCADAPRIVLNRYVNSACVSLGIPSLGAFGGFVGPIYLPEQSPCFNCFENAVLRPKANGYWDLMVQALASQPPPPIPSFVAGPIYGALLQFLECVGHLTGAWPLRTSGTILKTDSSAITGEEKIAVDPGCEVCQRRIAVGLTG